VLREGLVGDDVAIHRRHPERHLQLHPERDGGEGVAFADVLAEAQRLGYAESDPTMDVGGYDAAHKIVLLAALAFAPRRTTPPPRSRGWKASRRSTSGWPATSAIASS
jgi:hypothetical protein